MVKYKVSEFFFNQIRSLTIEPLIFLYSFGLCVTSGAQITTNLLIWKICRDRLEYSEETCGNLTLEVIIFMYYSFYEKQRSVNLPSPET
jgi:hypothetical protein